MNKRPPSSAEAPAPSANGLLAELHAFVEQCSTDLEAGNYVSLAGLDEKVDQLCKTVLALPRDEAKSFSVRLDNLLKEIRVMGDRMEDNRKALQAQLEGLNVHRKAAVAYQTASGNTAPSLPKPDDEDEQ